MSDLALTFAAGILAGTVSGVAGGGGGLFAAPFFILLGMPAAVAVGTAKFGAFGVTIGALAKFRGSDHIRKEYLLPLTLLAVIAGVIGPLVLLQISDELATKIVGWILLAAIPFLFLKKEFGLTRTETTIGRKLLGFALYFIVVVIQAAFSGGIGLILPIIMMGLFGFTALDANATRRLPALVGAAVTLATFIAYSAVFYGHGTAMLLGSLVGGWIGTHIALKQGERFVRWALCAVLVLMGAKLVFG